MIIMNYNYTSLANFDQVGYIFIGGDKKTIKICFANNTGCELARYSTEAQVKYALEMLYMAISGGNRCFRFPTEREINERMSAAKFAHSHVKTKENRHGGS